MHGNNGFIDFSGLPTAALLKNNLMAQYERGKPRLHLFGNGVAPVLRNAYDGDRSYTAVTAMGADPNVTADSFVCER
jgi:hypothetical protein